MPNEDDTGLNTLTIVYLIMAGFITVLVIYLLAT